MWSRGCVGFGLKAELHIAWYTHAAVTHEQSAAGKKRVSLQAMLLHNLTSPCTRALFQVFLCHTRCLPGCSFRKAMASLEA